MSSAYTVLHQNIQSLRSNFDTFAVYLASLSSPVDLIFVSEIWIYSHECVEYGLPDYELKACCNDSYRSGGVGVFVHKNIVVDSFVCFNWNTADLLMINVIFDNKPWTFICIYRFCDSDIDLFCNELESLLCTLRSNNVIILGDININLLINRVSYNYETMLASYGFLSRMNDPTRSNSCLDHVFVKSYDNITVDNLPFHFSDHNLIKIHVLLSCNRPIYSNNNATTSQINYNNLKEYLKFEDWYSVLNELNCSIAFDNFISILKSHIESSRFITTHQKNTKLKPWMNSQLLFEIRKLKKYSKKLRRFPNNKKLVDFVQKLTKQVKSNVKSVKTTYYRNKFKIVGKNSKLMWKTIDDMLGRTAQYNCINRIYKFESDVLLTTPDGISNEFNDFFVNIPVKLTSGLSDMSLNSNDFKRHALGSHCNYIKSCFFEPINSFEILTEIKKLGNYPSKGLDEVDNFIVKECRWYLVDVLQYLFNLSLSSGIFPESFKTAVVIPIYKKGDKTILNNYRPISLLSTLSKIFEKLIKQRLLGYLDSIHFLNNNQFGFTSGKSTEEAILHFLSPLYSALNKSAKPTALFVDITKAFDTVDHNILLFKLSGIGIRGTILDWFESYLRSRRQYVRVGETLSSSGSLVCGVPQGSVLGPILFLIYFNSIFEINLIGHCTAFADDLVLSYESKDTCADVQPLLDSDLLSLSRWFYFHRLILSEKSRVMHFGRSNPTTLLTPTKYHIYSCNKNPCSSLCFELEVVNEFKYLGLTIDYQLNWNSHLSNIKKSVIIAVHKFYRLKDFCPSDVLRKLYHALVESVIMYGITSWGGIYFSNIEDLFIAQKRIVKIIYNCPKTTPTLPLFRDLNLLPLRYLYVYKVLKMFFARSNSFHNRITHTYSMRNPNIFAGFRCNNEKCRRFYLYMAPYWFHMLPRHIKLLTSERINKILKETRTWLLNIDNIENYF